MILCLTSSCHLKCDKHKDAKSCQASEYPRVFCLSIDFSLDLCHPAWILFLETLKEQKKCWLWSPGHRWALGCTGRPWSDPSSASSVLLWLFHSHPPLHLLQFHSSFTLRAELQKPWCLLHVPTLAVQPCPRAPGLALVSLSPC